jgi:ABC-type transport system involved in multi-copper enzyme maturation permease subunit
MLRRSARGRADEDAVAGARLFSSTDVNGFEAVGLALQAGLPVLAFLALALGSQSLAAEYARGTLRNVLLRPVTRTATAVGKSLALLVLVLAGYLALAGAALALGAVSFGFGDASEILPNGARFVLTPAAEIWPVLRRALVAPLLPLAAYTALGFLAGAVARTGAAALGLALALGVLLDLGRAFTRGSGLDGSLPSDHLPSPLSDTSVIRFYVDVAQGVSNAQLEHARLAWIAPAAWTLLAFLLAAWRLARRPIP